MADSGNGNGNGNGSGRSSPTLSTTTTTTTTTADVLTSVTTGVYPDNSFVSTISTVTLNETIQTDATVVQNIQGTNAGGDHITGSTMDTLPNADNDAVDIDVNLGQIVESYYNNVSDPTSETVCVVNDIKAYAAKINCESFQGKGTIEDYNELFLAASKIANETKHMHLEVDVAGFNEFASAADELSALFNGFIVKLQSINIIDDLAFLKSIRTALSKIANLAETFGKFKETIMATAAVELPKSAHDTKVVIEEVMSEVNCAMRFINHYVNPDPIAPEGAALSSTEKEVIRKAVSTIDNWSILCEQDVTIAMSSSPDIAFIKNASIELSTKATHLRGNIASLRSKLNVYKNL